MQEMNISLTNWEARFIIEALKQLEAKWLDINHTTEDEDEQAEYANDLSPLGLTKDRFISEATKVFGKSIATYDRAPVKPGSLTR